MAEIWVPYREHILTADSENPHTIPTSSRIILDYSGSKPMPIDADVRLLCAGPELKRALKTLVRTALKTDTWDWAKAIGRAGTNRPIDQACEILAKVAGVDWKNMNLNALLEGE